MALELLVPDYTEMKTTLSGAVSKGDSVTLNETNGFYFVDGVSGDVASVVTKARKVSGPLAAVAVVEGEAAYINAGNLTNVSAGGTLIGYFIESVDNTGGSAGDLDAIVDFDGMLAFAKA
jgi:hypothetical protein